MSGRRTSLMGKALVAAAILINVCLGGQQGHCGETMQDATYRRLDNVLARKKQQLVDYLERIQKNADQIRTDSLMVEFFNIKSTFYELQKTAPPPDKLREMIEVLKECVQERYLEKYLLFYDILFINRNGDIFYTIRKESDYHQNLFEGELAKTSLSQQLRQGSGKAFVDYRYYESSGEPSAFVVEPVMKNDQLLGWFVMQCAVRRINSMFTREGELGETGEVFLVNSERQLLTDSRFFGDTSILKRHLSRENITAKFQEKKGHKRVTDYRDHRALSSFEVCPIMGSEWLLIAKIDEDEVITEYYRQNRDQLRPLLLQHFMDQQPAFCHSTTFTGDVVRVDMDDFRKASHKEVLHTFGVATCTAIVASHPKTFSFMAHLSTYDQIYGGTATDLIAHMIKRIDYFEVDGYQRQQLQFTLIAKHVQSVGRAIDALIDDGFLLSQIRFIYNPAAVYGTVFHDYATNSTLVDWSTGRGLAEHQFQRAADMETIGDAVKSMVGYP